MSRRSSLSSTRSNRDDKSEDDHDDSNKSDDEDEVIRNDNPTSDLETIEKDQPSGTGDNPQLEDSNNHPNFIASDADADPNWEDVAGEDSDDDMDEADLGESDEDSDFDLENDNDPAYAGAAMPRTFQQCPKHAEPPSSLEELFASLGCACCRQPPENCVHCAALNGMTGSGPYGQPTGAGYGQNFGGQMTHAQSFQQTTGTNRVVMGPGRVNGPRVNTIGGINQAERRRQELEKNYQSVKDKMKTNRPLNLQDKWVLRRYEKQHTIKSRTMTVSQRREMEKAQRKEWQSMSISQRNRFQKQQEKLAGGGHSMAINGPTKNARQDRLKAAAAARKQKTEVRKQAAVARKEAGAQRKQAAAAKRQAAAAKRQAKKPAAAKKSSPPKRQAAKKPAGRRR